MKYPPDLHDISCQIEMRVQRLDTHGQSNQAGQLVIPVWLDAIRQPLASGVVSISVFYVFNR